LRTLYQGRNAATRKGFWIVQLKPTRINWPAVNRIQKFAGWIAANKAMFLIIALITFIALIPLYGVLYPPVVDLPEHILVSKLLWEKLTGTSHLDLTISWFLGYRLFPILMLVLFSFCTLFRISFGYLPAIVAGTLISIHAIVIVSIVYFQLRIKSRKALALAVCFLLPAVVGMYSAAWFLGLVNYTLAITLLVVAIFLTERFLCSGNWLDAGLLFLALVTIYMAHPFAPTFWVLWCLCRSLASIATLHLSGEWRRIALLPAIFLPIALYQFSYFPISRSATQAFPGQSLLKPPFLSRYEWYHRIHNLFSGYYLKADYTSDSRVFGLFAIGFILISTALAFYPRQAAPIKKMALSSLFFLLIASALSERFFPVPNGAWLAYDHRYSSTVYVVCLTMAAMVLIRSLPVSSGKSFSQKSFALLAVVAVLASVHHLLSVRKSYVRFDIQARMWTARVFVNEQPDGIYLPYTPWHPDGTYLKHYVCLRQPDCVSSGTTFGTGYVADLFPVKLRPFTQPDPTKDSRLSINSRF
jgi:hypothetical protein